MSWVLKSLGKSLANDDGSDSDDGSSVILIYTTNAAGKDVYIYLQLPSDKVDEVKHKLENSVPFTPSDYGTVLAAGLDKPTQEIKDEIGKIQHMIYFEEPELPAGIPSPPPKLW